MNNTKVAIYVRVSTQEQATEGYSIGEQTERLKKFAEAHDWNIVNVYTDAGYSGATMDRPALNDMLADIHSGRIDKVLVYKLDRLSRSQKDTLKLIEDEFLKYSTDFESMTEKLDTTTAHGKAMIGILAAFAQLEREMITERMMLGLVARIKEGKWKGGANPPFGYSYDKASGTLLINDYEAMIIREIFTQYLAGDPLHKISRSLVEKGHCLRNGRMDIRNLRYILQNKVYIGFIRHNKEWLKGLHQPIISEETFRRTQEKYAQERKRYMEGRTTPRTNISTTHFGGLIHCAWCGALYSKNRTGTKKYGEHWKYTCYSRSKKVDSMIKDPACKNKSFDIAEFDNMIFNEIKKLAIDPDYITRLQKGSVQEDINLKITAITQKIKTITAQLSRMMDLYSLGTFSLAELDAKTKPVIDQRNSLQKELQALQNASNQTPQEEVIKIASSFAEALENGTFEDRRTIIEALIDKIIIDGDNVTIHWNFT